MCVILSILPLLFFTVFGFIYSERLFFTVYVTWALTHSELKLRLSLKPRLFFGASQFRCTSSLRSPAAAPVFEVTAVCVALTRLGVGYGRRADYPVVMATANRKCPEAGNASGLLRCVAHCLQGNWAHYCCSVFPSAPTMPPPPLQQEQPRS